MIAELNKNLKSPFPYFGGKSMIASKVWEYLGDVKQYIEPFFGSGAVLLKRPSTNLEKIYEIVCDKDGFVANVWRAIQFNPDEVAKWCDWPINHIDLVARRKTLIANEQKLIEGLTNNPEWFDAKLAGYWVWAASCWIGSGLTSESKGGTDTRPMMIDKNNGIHSQRPHLARDSGVGSKRPHIADKGVNSKIPILTKVAGINQQIPKISAVQEFNDIYSWMQALSNRLRYVKVVCGDWTRVCGGNWQANNKPCGMFFDPPYATDCRDDDVYHHDSLTVGKDVEKWVLGRGQNKDYRIVVCGYEGEYQTLIADGWNVGNWSAGGGYANRNSNGMENRHKERLFISPYCQKTGLFQ
jgi:DNA adenine methylase